MPSSRQIRQQFIDYFAEKHGHEFVPSSPVVPHDDPTLLFTNAGMNQFKDIFLGTGTRDSTRAVNSQKCIRAGGKHNDLEDVGKDTYHHTFFEMLGNWSFGDYFKKEAISWAWELLTEVWGLPKDRLHATVFAGDEGDGLEPDTEAEALWKSETDIDPKNIHRCGKKDNFWEMGDSGPCGPCSEIHIDRTPDRSGASLVNADDARVIEVWNLVFIQFNRGLDGQLSPLPACHVDTGMGFERITSVLQNKSSNYDTDVFAPLFESIQEVSGAKAYGGVLEDPVDVAYRVIADHLRCLTFALTDGATPSNEGRGYVLRRILRRAVRHGRQTLGIGEPFLHRLVPSVVDSMSEVFPELGKNPEAVSALIEEEEKSFGRTLDRGLQLFEEAAEREASTRRIPAKDAFMLHDTFGFPLDLTQVMAEERGFSVDVDGFETLMEEARRKARGASSGGAGVGALLVEIVQKHDLSSEFLGDEAEELSSAIVGVFRLTESRAEEVETGKSGESLAIVTEKTPFYAESGGQVGDTGEISVGGAVFAVEGTLKAGSAIFHLGRLRQDSGGEITRGAEAELRVDSDRRRRIRQNHTGTHLLNHALRELVHSQTDQKGSLVDGDKLRFDFSASAAMTREQLVQVEQRVNEEIDADLEVFVGYGELDATRRINGLRAVFGEKYPEKVRVVSIGKSLEDLLADPENEAWRRHSVEFCGGTHLRSTGEAELFSIVQEEAVAKGIRRVLAFTGDRAKEVIDRGKALLQSLDELRRGEESELDGGLSRLSQEINEATIPAAVASSLRKGLSDLHEIAKAKRKEKSRSAASGVVDRAGEIADRAEGPVLVASLEGVDAELLRKAMDVIRKKQPQVALLLGAAGEEKCAFVASVPPALVEKGLRAGDWVREVAKVAGGGGGGRPDMAQAGGKDPSKLEEALEVGREFARGKI